MTNSPISDLMFLPYELLEEVFQYLSPADLSRLAICSRRWRCAVNQELLWRLLCRRNGWEHYGLVTNLTTEIPYDPSRHHMDAVSDTYDNPPFPMDAIVTDGNHTGLTRTCKWKEVYMKARHLESNWEKNHCHVTSLKAFDDDLELKNGRPYVRSTDGEGDLFALGLSNGTVKVWNVRKGTCEHVIPVILCGYLGTLKVKNGIIVAGCAGGLIRAFRASSGEELYVMQGHKETDIQRIFFDGEIIVSRAKSDDDIRVWNVLDGACRHILSAPGERDLKDLDYRDKMVAAAYSDNCLRLWDAGSGVCLHTYVDNCPSPRLGDGIVASLCAEFGRSTLKIRSADSGECTKSLPVEDLEDHPGSAWIENCFSNGGLFLRSLHNNRNYDGMYINAYNRGVHFMTKLGYLKAVFCFNGNKCILEDRYDYADNECHIYKASADGLKLTTSLKHKQDHKLLTVWMDDFKVIFRDLTKDMSLYVYHYW